MNYKETVDYLFAATPQFQQIGAAAYKPGLDTARALDAAFGHPHHHYPIIHVAGTNGKGSTCHTLAAILQAQGYRVGLFTSPHLVDFRERIRVNGEMISEAGVVDFVERYLRLKRDGDGNGNRPLEGIEPSFFELTTTMAMDYFAHSHVDFVVLETGLGGRLDTTNIVSPILTVITNISFDHKAQLGNTLQSIATEKAGIMKRGVDVVVGNAEPAEVHRVFAERAATLGIEMTIASESNEYASATLTPEGIRYTGTIAGDIIGELTGDCQRENAATVLAAVGKLRGLGVTISNESIAYGFANVVETTGLMGRWMKYSQSPLTLCDTGHNEGGWQYLGPRLASYGADLHVVIGFVSDKDVDHILGMMPRDAHYYFAQASVPRAMSSALLAEKASTHGLRGATFATVADAYHAACDAVNETITANPDNCDPSCETRGNGSPLIFVGGSTFVVADLLAM